MSILKKKKLRENEHVVPIRDVLVEGSKYVKFSLNVPRPLHKAFKRKAFLDEKDMSDILLAAIDAYMKS